MKKTAKARPQLHQNQRNEILEENETNFGNAFCRKSLQSQWITLWQGATTVVNKFHTLAWTESQRTLINQIIFSFPSIWISLIRIKVIAIVPRPHIRGLAQSRRDQKFFSEKGRSKGSATSQHHMHVLSVRTYCPVKCLVTHSKIKGPGPKHHKHLLGEKILLPLGQDWTARIKHYTLCRIS